MAFFWFAKQKIKSNAYAILQRYLVRYAPLYQIDLNPKDDTYSLIEQFCKKNPDVFKYDLHSVSVAGGALLLALENCYVSDSEKEANFFLFCLGQVLIDIEVEENQLKLNGYDRKFINGCASDYQTYSLKLEGYESSCQSDERVKNDPEFEEKNNHLNIFLQAQEFLLTMGSEKLQFKNDREKLKYLHFLFGAIDQLSRTIKDDKRAELWWMLTSTTRASLLLCGGKEFNEMRHNLNACDTDKNFQRGIAEAFKVWESYGNADDAELFDAGKRGYLAMQTYILSAVDKCTPEEFKRSCTELFTVVYAK